MAEKPKRERRPKQRDLPGMEDAILKDLEDAADAYNDVKNDRVELSARETELQCDLLNLMHKYDKTKYSRGTLEVVLIVEKEKVKVTRHKEAKKQKKDADKKA